MVGHLLVEAALAEADLADLLKQVLEIVLAEKAPVFQPLLVEHVAFDGELAQDGGGPLAELGGADGIDPVADGDDGIEVVVLGIVAFTVAGSYPEIPDN
jgi:hypothetical protein